MRRALSANCGGVAHSAKVIHVATAIARERRVAGRTPLLSIELD